MKARGAAGDGRDQYDVLVVGASLVGHTVAESLRDRGYRGSVCLLGAEESLPYDRPPLTKAVLTAEEPPLAKLGFRGADWYADHGIDLRLGRSAVSLERLNERMWRVALDDHRQVDAATVVVATGSRARRLAGVPELPDRIFHVRSVADAMALRARLHDAPGHLVVVGGGFIGLEIAAAAVACGWNVEVVERDSAPLARVLPPELGAICWDPYAARGCAVRTDVAVQSVRETVTGLVVQLSDGSSILTDAVVVAAGGVANAEWLASSGLQLADGIPCNGLGQTELPGVLAAGDVARWAHTGGRQLGRCQQWQAARSQALVVAAHLAGGLTEEWSELPYFWSELMGGRALMVGAADAESELLAIKRSPVSGAAVAVLGHGGIVTAIFAHQFPRTVGRARQLLGGGHVTAAEAGLWLDALVPADWVLGQADPESEARGQSAVVKV